jgi:hypothetical protein
MRLQKKKKKKRKAKEKKTKRGETRYLHPSLSECEKKASRPRDRAFRTRSLHRLSRRGQSGERNQDEEPRRAPLKKKKKKKNKKEKKKGENKNW